MAYDPSSGWSTPESRGATNIGTLTARDVEAIARTAQSEYGAYARRDPNGLKAVVDAILNRVASEEFPDTISAVVNQPNQFSAISGNRNAVGSWTALPKASDYVQSLVEEHLAERAAGKPSVIGSAVNFLNPAAASPKQLGKWGWDVVEQAIKSGLVFGFPGAQHFFGTAPNSIPAPEVTFSIDPTLDIAMPDYLADREFGFPADQRVTGRGLFGDLPAITGTFDIAAPPGVEMDAIETSPYTGLEAAFGFGSTFGPTSGLPAGAVPGVERGPDLAAPWDPNAPDAWSGWDAVSPPQPTDSYSYDWGAMRDGELAGALANALEAYGAEDGTYANRDAGPQLDVAAESQAQEQSPAASSAAQAGFSAAPKDSGLPSIDAGISPIGVNDIGLGTGFSGAAVGQVDPSFGGSVVAGRGSGLPSVETFDQFGAQGFGYAQPAAPEAPAAAPAPSAAPAAPAPSGAPSSVPSVSGGIPALDPAVSIGVQPQGAMVAAAPQATPSPTDLIGQFFGGLFDGLAALGGVIGGGTTEGASSSASDGGGPATGSYGSASDQGLGYGGDFGDHHGPGD